VASDTQYKSIPWTFDSKGLMSRPSTDRPPDAHFYQNMEGCFEREESAMSSRYGSVIVNRDPDGTPSGQNHPLPSAPVTLSRILGLSGVNYRYAGLANGTLWRRAGTTQGPYVEIASGLSGDPYTSIVTTMFGSSLPYLMIYDRTKLLKDSGTGSPTSIGIFPPVKPIIATAYAPEVQLIDTFSAITGYGPSNMVLGGPLDGEITSVSVVKNNIYGSGTGFHVGDVLTITQLGGANGQVVVTSLDPGSVFLGLNCIRSVALVNPGTGYTTATNLPATGGSGTGAAFNIVTSGGTGLYTTAVVAGASGASILSGDHEQYTDTTGSYSTATDGMIATSATEADGLYRLKFGTFPVNNTYEIVSIGNNAYAATDTFTFTELTWLIAASTVGYIGKSIQLDLSKYQGDDLIVLVVQCSHPENVQGIQVEFDVNGSNYGASYYWKSVIPVSWQGSVSMPSTNDPTTAMVDAVFDLAMGITNTSQNVGQSTAQSPTVPNSLQGVQPSQMGSGQNSWSVIYLPKGQFQPAGNAGQSGADWSKITGWRIQVTTNSNGSSNVGFNALYIQGSPTSNGVGTNAGASSYGGVGYDFRQTFYDASTMTESNGCPSAYFSVTPTNPGGSSTLVPLRQAIDLQLQYSSNPSCTHVRIYARGGVFGDNWHYADQVPNPSSPPKTNVSNILSVQLQYPGSGFIAGLIVVVDSDVDPGIVGTTVTITGMTGGASFLNGTTFTVTYAANGLIEGSIFLVHTNYGPAPDTGTATANAGNFFSSNKFHYTYILPDAALEQGNILSLTNDVPVTSTLPNPISTTVANALNPLPANTNTPTLLVVESADASAVFVPNQVVDVGGPQNLEQVYVVAGGTGSFTAYIQLPHPIGDPINVYATPGQPLYLAALAYGQMWMAGDTNNPHYLYYTPKDQPQYCPPQNYVPIGSPSDPITAVINYRGQLLVRTRSTWYPVFPGNPPTYQSSGSKHGSPASFDWCLTESEIWYQAWDGIRTFRGADGKYESLIIEWLYRNNPLSIVPPVDLTQLGSVISAFKNNTATFVYVGVDQGLRHRLRYSTSYKRWRNDNVYTTALLVEPDTNQLLMAVPYPHPTGGNQWAIVYEDISKDYDDGGWSSNGSLVQDPITMNLQLPYMDVGALNNAKSFNDLTIDANPNNQEIGVQLLFDDDNGNVAPINLGTFTGAVRDKYHFVINSGLGQQAYRISPVFTADVTEAPILYQAEIEAAVLADQRSSYDSYQHKFGTDEYKLVKEFYCDYTTSSPANGIHVQLFADGDTVPYYEFDLPANANRSEVPMRVRFPAIKLRLFRMVMTSLGTGGSFQLWSSLTVKWKPAKSGGGYQPGDLGGLTPA
jgi:hypothetical protein